MTDLGILSWLTAGPVLLQTRAGLTPVGFGWMAVITGVAYAIAGLSNGCFVVQYGLRRMLSIGLLLMLFGAVSMLLLSIIFKEVGVIIIVLPMAIFFAGTGFMFANAYAGALGPFVTIAGIAGSLFSFMQIAGGAVSSGILAHAHEETQRPLALLICVAAVVASIAFLFIRKRIGEH
ncbi:MAG: multidrug effflux MFS transporter [Gammaproteobacteria bacterium]|nr:multidrug effflux MFS transporter [Gammaproteobacteria bacterium]